MISSSGLPALPASRIGQSLSDVGDFLSAAGMNGFPVTALVSAVDEVVGHGLVRMPSTTSQSATRSTVFNGRVTLLVHAFPARSVYLRPVLYYGVWYQPSNAESGEHGMTTVLQLQRPMSCFLSIGFACSGAELSESCDSLSQWRLQWWWRSSPAKVASAL